MTESQTPKTYSLTPREVAPFAAWLGVEAISAQGGRALLRLDPREELLNRRDVLHGGVLATLLDTAMARASRTVDGVRELAGTADLHVQFMRPAIGVLQAEGWVEHAGGTLAFCRGEVRNAQGELVASGSATMRLLR